MSESNSSPIALTCGDPAGVGPEIILEWLVAQPSEVSRYVPIGPRRWLNALGVEGIAVGDPDFHAVPGKPDAAGAKIAWEAMELAAKGCIDKKFAAVVTGPVSKKNLAEVGYPFQGQTEFFADCWGGEPTMGFVGERMRMVLASWHWPLRIVPERLQREHVWIERAVQRASELCHALGMPSPRIAVCGLNPHAGEQGMLGDEEISWIDPLLTKLRQRFPGLSQALPADTVFHRQLRGDFDIVVALYHDQGLAPLKTIEFDSAVNITLGLPHIRTSPDHGTAYDIAGKGTASTKSWNAAVKLAERLSS